MFHHIEIKHSFTEKELQFLDTDEKVTSNHLHTLIITVCN